MLKYALTGNPLGHSMSAVIHHEILKIKNIEGNYELKPTDNLEKSFKEDLSKLNGFNVTIPYKKDIIKFLDSATDKVKLYHACNTVLIKEGKAYGYNTDVYGINDTFKKNSIDLSAKKVLVTGNGGVSSLMACEAALKGAEVYITARNYDKAKLLIDEVFKKTGRKIKFVEREEFSHIDVLMQGTPLGMYPHPMDSFLPLTKLKDIPVVFDTIYNPYKTLTVRVCEYYGNLGLGGLNMLVEQAIKAQEIFNGITLDKKEFRQVLNKAKEHIPEFKAGKNIILIGAPGCGKSAISREISKLLDMKIIDIDTEIVKKEGRSINEIFESDGQNYFRNVEREVFFEKIKTTGNVIATGGGLPEFCDLSELSEKENIIVYVNVDKDVIYNRIEKDTSRPLLKNNKKTALYKLIQRRHPIYKKACHVEINVEKERNIKDIVVEIIEKSIRL